MTVRFRGVGAVALAAVLATAGLAGCNRNEAAQPARTQTTERSASSSSSSSGSTGGGYSDRSDRGSYGSSRSSERSDDRGGSDRGGSDRRASDRGGYSGGRYANDNRDEARPRQPIPDFHGKPMWSDNRRHTAEENAQYHFDRSGSELGAKTLDDFLTKVHSFVDHPPASAQTLTRSNGDKLIYDPKSNTFAVARKDGAPRTAFKPRDGADYWREQQARVEREKSGGSYTERRSSRADRDEG